MTTFSGNRPEKGFPMRGILGLLVSVLAFLVLLGAPSGARAGVLQSNVFDPTGTNFATTFTLAGANNLSVPNGLIARQFCYLNTNAAMVAFHVDTDTGSSAPTADVNDIYAAASMTVPVCTQGTRLTRTLQIRSASGSTISTGTKVYVWFLDGKG